MLLGSTCYIPITCCLALPVIYPVSNFIIFSDSTVKKYDLLVTWSKGQVRYHFASVVICKLVTLYNFFSKTMKPNEIRLGRNVIWMIFNSDC